MASTLKRIFVTGFTAVYLATSSIGVYAVTEISAAPSDFTVTVEGYYDYPAIHWGNLLDALYDTYASTRDFSLLEYKYYYVKPLVATYPGLSEPIAYYRLWLTNEPLVTVDSYAFLDSTTGSLVSGTDSVLSWDTEGIAPSDGWDLVSHSNGSLSLNGNIQLSTSNYISIDAVISPKQIFSYDFAVLSYDTQTRDVVIRSKSSYDYQRSDLYENGSALLYNFYGVTHGLEPIVPYMSGVTIIGNNTFHIGSGEIGGIVTNSVLPIDYSDDNIYNILYQSMFPDGNWALNAVGKDSLAWAKYYYYSENPTEQNGTLANEALSVILDSIQDGAGTFTDVMDEFVTPGDGVIDNVLNRDIEAQVDELTDEVDFAVAGSQVASQMSGMVNVIPFLLPIVTIAGVVMLFKRILQH